MSDLREALARGLASKRQIGDTTWEDLRPFTRACYRTFALTVERIISAAGYRILAPGAELRYEDIPVPSDIAEFGARHKLEEFGNATYRNGYMDGYRAALRTLGEGK